MRILQKIAVSKSSSIGIVQIMDKCYVMSFSEQQKSDHQRVDARRNGRFLQQSLEKPAGCKLAKIFSEWLNKAKAEIAGKRGKQNEDQRQRYQDHGCGPFQQFDASADGVCARHGRRQLHHQQFIVEWEWLVIRSIPSCC